MLLVGVKVTGAKELVQINERRKELKANLVLLQAVLEDENKIAWIHDVTHDTKERMHLIAELSSSLSSLSYSLMEEELLKKGADMFAAFEASSAAVKPIKHAATIMYSETKYVKATGLLFGRTAAMVRAPPQEIVAHMLHFDSRFNQSNFDREVFVRSAPSCWNMSTLTTSSSLTGLRRWGLPTGPSSTLSWQSGWKAIRRRIW